MRVLLYKTPTRSAPPSKVSARTIRARRTCGGKRICLSAPPSWPSNDAAKRTAPAQDHPDLIGEKIEDSIVPNPEIDESTLPNPLNPSLPVISEENEYHV